MTDQLDDLFTDLRTDALHLVRPPGADAARRTLRRRRATRSVAAAAGLTLAGAGTFLAVPGHGTPTSDTPADRVAAAAAAVPPRPGDLYADQGVAGEDRTMKLDSLGGGVTLTAACAGSGMVTIIVRGPTERWLPPGSATPQDMYRVSGMGVDCSEAPTARSVHYPGQSGPGPWTVTVNANADASGRSGYAWRISAI